MYEYYFGIDISKDTFNLSVINEKENVVYKDKMNMSNKNFERLKDIIQKYGIENCLICIEATGIYHINLLIHLLYNNCIVSLVNPLLIKSFSKSVSLRNTKTDKVDAFTIAKFSKHHHQSLKLTTLADLDSLKSILREKETIEDSIVKLKNQIIGVMIQQFPELIREMNIFSNTMLKILLEMPSPKKLLSTSNKHIDNIINSSPGSKIKHNAKELKEILKNTISINDNNLELILQSKIRRLLFLMEQLKELDKLIDENIKGNDKLNSSIDILKSIDGIGDKTSKDFMIELGDINRFENHKKLTAYIGTDPSIKESGSSVNIKGKISKKGNSHLRRTIYKMASGVFLHNKVYKNYYKKKRNEGKTHKQSLIAVANKLIKLIYSMLINGTYYDANYYSLDYNSVA